jgi:VanZ family protein
MCVRGQNLLRFLTGLYTLFVVYGSLVPLTFRPRPLAEAWAYFLAIPYLNLSIESRADWVSNIVLFVPLSFLWMETIASGRGRLVRAVTSFGVFVSCFCLAIAIEFTQIFFPPRTVSLNDIVAEGMGAIIGVACAVLFGARARGWVAKLDQARGTATLADRALWIYLGLVVLYNVMPLDLTISPAEIYHKWEQGRVVLNPFQSLINEPVQWMFGTITDILVWTPVALLWMLAGRDRPSAAFLLTVGTAAVVELAQLFVYTRISDVGDIATAALGGALGAIIGSKLNRRDGSTSASTERWAVAGAIATVAWFCTICALFWYPFDFRADFVSLSDRLGSLEAVPFLSYYWSSEYYALSGLLRKMLLFLPLGVALAIAFHPFRDKRARRFAAVATALVALVSASTVEIGKAFLPGRRPDSTDLFLQFLGCVAGYMLFAAARARIEAASFEEEAASSADMSSVTGAKTTPVTSPVANTRQIPRVWRLTGAVAFLGSVLWALSLSSFVPYNYRSLFHPSYPHISMFLVAAALAWSAGFPAWISRSLATHERAIVMYPLWIFFYGLVAWTVTFFAVEPFRAYKLVGAPILNWPWHFEFILRFLALMAAIGGFAVLGCIVGGDEQYFKRRLIVWLFNAVWLLPLVYWAVIVEAATDNITELLAWNASPLAAFLIGLVLATIFAAATKLRTVFSYTSSARRTVALVFALLSFPVGYLLLGLGTEPVINKYEKIFSGMQFMLSADREHYAQGTELFVRYLIFHLVVLVAAATGRWMFLESPRRNPLRN